MHPRIDQLLSWCDGQPVAASTRQHAENCAICSAAVRQLLHRQQSMRELAQFEPPPIDHAQIRARALVAPPVHGASAGRRRAIAAVLVACSLVVGFVALERSRDAELPIVHTAPGNTERASGADADERAYAPVAQLVEQSRELDALLQNLPQPPQVQRVSLAATVDRIEQRVQWLDVQLSSVPDASSDDELAHQLWRERVDLMDSLVKVRYAEALPGSF